jgi:dienelactone hydrolase
MPKQLPSVQVLALAARRRLERLIGRERNAFADSPAGLALSPSARHFADYPNAPLALRFAGGRWPDAADWQRQARAKLAELCGYSRAQQAPEASHSQTFRLGNGFERRRLYLQARPGVDIPVHLIAGPAPQAPRPVMICLQGTNTGAHLSWGEVRFPDDADKRQQGYDIATQAAARGYLAVAVEQSCFGERSERQIGPRSAAPCVDATMHAVLLGRSLAGERCSDVSAVIDWLIANHASLGIDPERIHVMGHSSGGTTAMFSAALDPRISAVLACGCVGFIRDTIGRRRDDNGQGVIPGILNWMEAADIVGLVAPRPFVTVAGDTDHIWPASGAEAVTAEARAVYVALGASQFLECVSAPGGHSFRPEVSWRTFLAVESRSSR